MTTPVQPRTAELFCSDLLKNHGITYKAEFVPQSRSRRAGIDPPVINWRVTGRRVKPRWIGNPRTIPRRDQERRLAEEGADQGQKLAVPLFEDVLWCLVSDADALEYPDFEEWAQCYGYDTDSRKAEAAWRECIDIALKLRAILPDLEDARRHFQDY